MISDPQPPAGRLTPPAADAPATAGGEVSRLVEIMRLLRSPAGCPWDREQTLASLAPFVLEEAHEVVDAIERGDLESLRGEIGDLVFEGVFLAQLCSETGSFSVADALRSVNEKLVRRHPHVFVQPEGHTAAEPTAIDTAGHVPVVHEGRTPAAPGTLGRTRSRHHGRAGRNQGIRQPAQPMRCRAQSLLPSGSRR